MKRKIVIENSDTYVKFVALLPFKFSYNAAIMIYTPYMLKMVFYDLSYDSQVNTFYLSNGFNLSDVDRWRGYWSIHGKISLHLKRHRNPLRCITYLLGSR